MRKIISSVLYGLAEFWQILNKISRVNLQRFYYLSKSVNKRSPWRVSCRRGLDEPLPLSHPYSPGQFSQTDAAALINGVAFHQGDTVPLVLHEKTHRELGQLAQRVGLTLTTTPDNTDAFQ